MDINRTSVSRKQKTFHPASAKLFDIYSLIHKEDVLFNSVTQSGNSISSYISFLKEKWLDSLE